MDRVRGPTPTPETLQRLAGAIILSGKGWHLIDTDRGFLLRALVGAEGGRSPDVPVTEAEATALRQGDVTAAELFSRAGVSLTALQQAHIYATNVSFSDEARRLSGMGQATGGTAKRAGGGAGGADAPQNAPPPLPLRPVALAAGVAVLIFIAFLMGVGR